MKKLMRFLYLNFYGILLLLAGIGFLSSNLVFKGTVWVIVQVILAFICFFISYNLLGMWDEKQRQYALLIKKNKDGFRPETFKMYMDAPCGRMVSRAVLKDLGLKKEYRQLLIYKPPLKELLNDLFGDTKKTFVEK